MAEDKNAEMTDASEEGAEGMSEAEIDRNLTESFPASDPPSWTLGTNHHAESSTSTTDEAERNKE